MKWMCGRGLSVAIAFGCGLAAAFGCQPAQPRVITQVVGDGPPLNDGSFGGSNDANAAGPSSSTGGITSNGHFSVPTGYAGATNSPDAALSAASPTAIQLHDLSGLLLLYYAVNHHLPQSLEQLAPYADADTPLSLIGPTSHQTYVYIPLGLQIAGFTRRIFVYDPGLPGATAHWCIVMDPPVGSRALAPDVVPVTDAALRRYAPAAPDALTPLTDVPPGVDATRFQKLSRQDFLKQQYKSAAIQPQPDTPNAAVPADPSNGQPAGPPEASPSDNAQPQQ